MLRGIADYGLRFISLSIFFYFIVDVMGVGDDVARSFLIYPIALYWLVGDIVRKSVNGWSLKFGGDFIYGAVEPEDKWEELKSFLGLAIVSGLLWLGLREFLGPGDTQGVFWIVYALYAFSRIKKNRLARGKGESK